MFELCRLVRKVQRDRGQPRQSQGSASRRAMTTFHYVKRQVIGIGLIPLVEDTHKDLLSLVSSNRRIFSIISTPLLFVLTVNDLPTTNREIRLIHHFYRTGHQSLHQDNSVIRGYLIQTSLKCSSHRLISDRILVMKTLAITRQQMIVHGAYIVEEIVILKWYAQLETSYVMDAASKVTFQVYA